MEIAQIFQIFWIGYMMVIAANVFWVLPRIDKLTEYTANGQTFTLPKNVRIWVLFAGVFCYLFLGRIRKIRKDKHYNIRLKTLKKFNPKGRKDEEILKLERYFKLSKLKRKSKRIILWQI